MKLDFINWYLVELRSHLHHGLPLDKQNSMIQETEIHLRSLSDDLQRDGMDAKSAEIAAIERFGTPQKIALECIVATRQQRQRGLIRSAAVVLVLVVLYVVTMNLRMIGQQEFYTAISIGLPIVIGFGIYAAILGRMPKARWFALPPLTVLAFGIYTGFGQTYFRVGYDSRERLVDYRNLHDRYLSLRTQHQAFGAVEHETADQLRKLLATYKDLKSDKLGVADKKELEVPGLIYQKQSVNSDEYEDAVTTFRYRGYDVQSVARTGTILNHAENHERFSLMPVSQKAIAAGPVSLHKIRTMALGSLQNIQGHETSRSHTLESMRQGLNLSIKWRITTIISSVLPYYLIIVLPLSILASFWSHKLRNRIFTKGRRTILA